MDKLEVKFPRGSTPSVAKDRHAFESFTSRTPTRFSE
jgi:hypothetical protein